MSLNDNRPTFETVVMPHLSDALALARWLTQNPADAEDVVQEACLRAYRSIDTYAGGNSRAWLLTIVRNTAFSWFQKNRQRDTVSIETLQPKDQTFLEIGGNWTHNDSATPEAALIEKADAAQLQVAISSLPVEFRETLVLRDIQGLEYREVAQIVGAPIGTVMSRLSRARRHLALALGKP